MAELGTDLREAFLREDWDLRLKQTILFAQGRINSLRWRRGLNGPLPDGYDANGVAAEAIKQLFDGDCRISAVPYQPKELDRELMRLASNLAHSLCRRKETTRVQSEQDLVPRNDDGDEDSGFERVHGSSPLADSEADRNEAKAKLQRFKNEFGEFLGKDQVLKDLFDSICAGILKREEIAELLGVETQVVTNARKRLDRRLADFAASNPQYPKTFIQEVINV